MTGWPAALRSTPVLGSQSPLGQSSAVHASHAGRISSGASTVVAFRIASAMLWLLVLWSSWNCIALYSDGSWFMMRIVDRGFFVNYDHARSYALGLWQVPLVFALRAGVTDLQWLAKAYSFGTLLLPAALYQLALLRSRDDAALMVGVIAAIAAVFSTSFMFSVGEYSTAYATAVAVMAFCARRDTARLTDGIVLLVLGVLSVRTYEIFYHLGPLLAALLVWRASRASTWSDLVSRWPVPAAVLLMGLPILAVALGWAGSFVLPAAVAVFIAGALSAAWLLPARTGVVAAVVHLGAAALFMSSSAFSVVSIHLRGGPLLLKMVALDAVGFWQSPPTDIAFLSLGLLVICALARPGLLHGRWPFLLAALPLPLLALMPLFQAGGWPHKPLITVHYLSRMLGGMAVVAMLVIAWLRVIEFRRRPRALAILDAPDVQRRALALVVALQIAVLPATLYAGFEWRAMLGDLRAVLQDNRGMMLFRDLPPTILRFFWDESDSSFIGFLSRGLQGHLDAALVAPPMDITNEPVPSLPGYHWRD